MSQVLSIIGVAFAFMAGRGSAFTFPVSNNPTYRQSIFSLPMFPTQAIIHSVSLHASSIILDRPPSVSVKELSDTDNKVNQEGKWHLILHNDKQNTKEWVAHSLHFVVGLSEQKAYNVMQAAHKHGTAFVGTYVYDVAECYRLGMDHNGITCDVIPAEDFQ